MKQKISIILSFLCALSILLCTSACNDVRTGEPKILVFSKTAGYHHASIASGNEALLKLGEENDFIVDTTTNAAYFVDDSLQQYSSVVFLSTTGDVLNHRQEAAFERYIQAGGGFAGIHAASDTEFHWGWFGRMVGGYFASHPPVQQATVRVLNNDHPATSHLPEEWVRSDEWYNFKDFNNEVDVLLAIDEETYEGGKNGNPHPVAWFHEYGGGRAFYTGLGHTEESFTDSLFLQHLLGGIRYTIGNNEVLDYSKIKTLNVPEEERFVKTVLTTGTLTEPTEMAILPNGDVLISQRRGEIMLYKNATGKVKKVAMLDVYHSSSSGANVEEGLLGIAADPEFEKNHHIFVFYSPADTSVNRLSRFEFRKDTIDPATEKIVLQFYSQRDICCHTGGSIDFGPDGLLYVSTGDNSTPFNEKGGAYVNNGFAPLDDRPGHEQYDARRSAGNSNDLRGKILRISVKEDGSYEIPAGNLFSPDIPKTRPEIYVMGNRNPYRISVDQKTGVLYWGEVGPDANADSLETRGPRGYDEINRATEAGFYGWPLFVGNNFPYRRYNYGNGESGDFFDADDPVNDSRNNTGVVNLPPAQPPLIWYPYGLSRDFPMLGSGGRTAMAGPVYYPDLYPKQHRYSDYYNAKFFFYDWVRNWVKVASFLPNGDLDKIEPFVENISFAAPMDIEVGPNGRIYVLEYGQGWFRQNPDAGLSRIDYIAGNLPPQVVKFAVNKTTGNLPFTITAKVEASDAEKDQLTYQWSFGKEQTSTDEPRFKHTFETSGEHSISVSVVDSEGGSATSEKITVYAGNEVPAVKIQLKGNRTFYFPGEPVKYQVKVTDDGDEVDLGNLYISQDYVEGKDLAGASRGHQQASEAVMGRNIMLTLDCEACHKINEKSIGPSYEKVAERYHKSPGALNYLNQKIITGGSGVWGEQNMPAHPALTPGEADKIVKWILSLTGQSNKKVSLPARGEVVPDSKKMANATTVLRLLATYTDTGGAGVKSLSGTDAVFLRNCMMNVNEIAEIKGGQFKDTLGTNHLLLSPEHGWLKIDKVDMKGINGIALIGIGTGQGSSFRIEIRSGSPDGEKLGEAVVNLLPEGQELSQIVPVQSEPLHRMNDIYLLFDSLTPGGKALISALRFIPDAKTE